MMDLSRRRLSLVAVTFAVLPHPSFGQQGRAQQIAILSASSVSTAEDAFRIGLRERGWDEGRNFVLVRRYADGKLDRLPQLAAELVDMKVDVIIASTPAALAAAASATKTIPIVMIQGPDPALTGLVASLSHPGGNITGLTSLSADLSVKQLELLKEIVPALSRAALLYNPANPWHEGAMRLVAAAAPGLGIKMRAFAVRQPQDLDSAFVAMRKERVEGILSLSDPMTIDQRVRLAYLAVESRLPTMNGVVDYTESGGLISYWAKRDDMFRRAADYVHRILSGARPGDLPIEQPTKFELVINMKTAKALGLRVPAGMLVRADRLIE